MNTYLEVEVDRNVFSAGSYQYVTLARPRGRNKLDNDIRNRTYCSDGIQTPQKEALNLTVSKYVHGTCTVCMCSINPTPCLK